MNPNEALREARRTAREIVQRDGLSVDPVDAAYLAESFLALDEWLSSGGFPPSDWADMGAIPPDALDPPPPRPKREKRLRRDGRG